MAVNILGVRIDEITKTDALKKASEFFLDGKQHTIFTPNPEMLVKSDSDNYFKQVLNSSDLNLCDGFGLWMAIKMKLRNTEIKKFVIERIAGVDFMLDLCRLAAEQGRSVCLLGSGSDEVVQSMAEALQKKFPSLKIAGFHKGIDILEADNNGAIEQLNNKKGLVIDEQKNSNILTEINTQKPDVIFVAFGMGKQEKWISENLSKMSSVKIAMGVGGAFDYISGRVKRAPLLMRKIGLEWVYRLIKQPKRIGRIFNATLNFLWLTIKNK